MRVQIAAQSGAQSVASASDRFRIVAEFLQVGRDSIHRFPDHGGSFRADTGQHRPRVGAPTMFALIIGHGCDDVGGVPVGTDTVRFRVLTFEPERDLAQRAHRVHSSIVGVATRPAYREPIFAPCDGSVHPPGAGA